MFLIRIVKYIFPTLILVSLFTSCTEKQNTRQKPKNQLALSEDISELISDSIHVNPLVDSLKDVFQFADSEKQIRLLGDLAENWRPFTYYLADEELKQSEKLINDYGKGDALCKFGIYYCRKFNFDSANYFLNKANSFAIGNNLNEISAQAISWKAEALRLSGEIEKSLALQDTAIALAIKSNDKRRLAFCNISKGEAYRFTSEFNKATECYNTAIAFASEINDFNKISICNNSLGEVYRIQNNYPKALEYFNNGLNIARKNKNNNQIAFCLSCMGDIYTSQKEFKKGLGFYEEAYKIAKDNGLKLQECNSLGSIGLAYYLTDEKTKALEFFVKTIKIAEEIGNKDKIAFSNTIMGDIYVSAKNYPKALECYQKSIAIATEAGNKTQLATSYNQLAAYFVATKNFTEAKLAAEKSFQISKETETPEGIKNASKLLSKINESQNNPAEALKMLHLFIQMRDSINSEESVKQMAAVEYKAKEQGLKAEQLAREEINQAELKRQKTIRYAFTIGFGLVLVLVIVVFRNLQQNKKKNKIITAQKAEVEHQKELVDEKNKEITDSITYAKRLQDAILPPLKMVKEVFPESFVTYIPKDIIAGDFYWMEHFGDFTFLAAADSTGHGVPGAMVSVVCSNALNRAVKEFKLTEPGLVLDKARELVLETFAKSEGDVKDGMDISLLCINRKNKSITWAGANNPLWYISPGKHEISEIKANKQPIGKTDNPLPFTTHSLPYVEGKIIYLITDGYADQFGGPKGKKFKYKQLEDLILANQNKPLSEQKDILEKTFSDWRMTFEQVDDVTILGVKI